MPSVTEQVNQRIYNYLYSSLALPLTLSLFDIDTSTNIYDEATALFGELKEYKDAATQAQESQYQKALALLEAGEDDSALCLFFSFYSFEHYSGAQRFDSKCHLKYLPSLPLMPTNL